MKPALAFCFGGVVERPGACSHLMQQGCHGKAWSCNSFLWEIGENRSELSQSGTKIARPSEAHTQQIAASDETAPTYSVVRN